MATLVTTFVVLPRVDGVQRNDAATLLDGLVQIDRDADLGAGEAGGYDNFQKAFVLTGLTKGQVVGLDAGTLTESTNTFAITTHSLELRVL